MALSAVKISQLDFGHRTWRSKRVGRRWNKCFSVYAAKVAPRHLLSGVRGVRVSSWGRTLSPHDLASSL
jgi:hypothetical protein